MKILNEIKKIREDKFLRDSIILTAAFFIFNASNFFYHFISARTLGPEDYAVVAALFSLVYILSVFSNVIQTSITKFTSTFYAKREFGKLKFLKNFALSQMFKYSLGIFLIYLILSPFIAEFLHVGLAPVIITGVLLLFLLVLPVNRGIMQGTQRFKMLGGNLIFEGLVKLILAIIFLYIGFGINGAIGAVVLGVAAAFFISFERITARAKKFDAQEVYRYSYPVLIAMMSITAMYSLDVLLVKHFLSSADAGFYSAISLLGKIVFFGATAISLVMFSKVSELHARNKEHKSVLNKALLLSAIIGGGLTAVYYVAGNLIVNIIFGSQYASIAPLLWVFGVFMTFLSFSYILALYNLSTGKKNFVILLVIFNLLQIAGIWLLSSSIRGVVYFLCAFSIVLFLLLFIFDKR